MEDHLPISYLRPDLSSRFYIIGVVISAERPRPAPTKYATTPASKRYVFNFSISDEHGDTINGSCWGAIDYVSPLSSQCYIGARVKIRNPRVRLAEEKSLAYLPEVTSPYKLYLDSQISSTLSSFDPIHDEHLSNALELAFRTPPTANYCEKVSVHDLLRADSLYSEGDFVTITAVVVEVGPILDCKIKERKCCRQEVKLMDQSSKEMHIILTLWEPMLQMFTLEWKPCVSVIQLTSVKVAIERSNNRKILSATSRSVVTIDPNTNEGRQLSAFAATLDASALSEFLYMQENSEQFNHNSALKISNVSALFDFTQRMNVNTREQVVLVCMVVNLRLDRGLCVKCGYCGRRIGILDESSGAPMCTNEYCRDKVPDQVLYFDVNVSVADSTGLMSKLRLTGDYALQTFGVSPERFLAMTSEEKQQIEHRFWLEYVEMGVLIEHRSNGRKTLNILHMEPTNFA